MPHAALFTTAPPPPRTSRESGPTHFAYTTIARSPPPRQAQRPRAASATYRTRRKPPTSSRSARTPSRGRASCRVLPARAAARRNPARQQLAPLASEPLDAAASAWGGIQPSYQSAALAASGDATSAASLGSVTSQPPTTWCIGG
eukprot:CAMPEP_0185329730 /NCGR_PEP_ID=MMETSP1363-20130426/75810_1 /TAXON_ID=38817 /ORGANISM="Gephyrocapsa oceanica, Strain RCC1303" /LENGTH=144 /DNA_ID=CAMNT_0027928561 /DNA_START=147 /DNA_END=579 /DNA_ORIENTATION=+